MLLFGPIPGGIELAVILLVTLVVLFGPVVLAVIAGLRLYNRRSSRLGELEAEVEELRERVEE
ncbi:hypothetical protein [Halalkalicoccus sp. NIPERK01]|uniref:hypothetical protein n=1 Tax=Halalkalicoccus sp. NIPERK01 TaxID=3053469 RepID=UPI00256EF397|nr:hypothetical protein [Halalkalicoccus sp. NIPERK01]MDL5361913.1 hypothetical protein [Halalkalicoccus sp. NIPERK01]